MDQVFDVENASASAFHVACCGVSERTTIKWINSLHFEDSLQLSAGSFNCCKLRESWRDRGEQSMAKKTLVTVNEVYLKSDRSSGNMVVLKENEEDQHHFIMFVGDSEFAAIAKEKGMVEPKRPLTHDLYLTISDNLPVEFLRIEIHDMVENTYYAKVFFRADGSEHFVDSRPSDAVALALNRKIPILVNKKLLRRELTPEEIKEYEEICKTVKF